MNRTFFFRTDKIGFEQWAKSLPICRSIIKEYYELEPEFKINHEIEYRGSYRVNNQYIILMASLNKQQKEYWHKRFVKWETPCRDDKESFYLEEQIFQNWREIVEKTQKINIPSAISVGASLRKARKLSGYSMRDVALILKINERTMQRYENGQYCPPINVFLGLMSLYGNNFYKISQLIQDFII